MERKDFASRGSACRRLQIIFHKHEGGIKATETSVTPTQITLLQVIKSYCRLLHVDFLDILYEEIIIRKEK